VAHKYGSLSAPLGSEHPLVARTSSASKLEHSKSVFACCCCHALRLHLPNRTVLGIVARSPRECRARTACTCPRLRVDIISAPTKQQIARCFVVVLGRDVTSNRSCAKSCAQKEVRTWCSSIYDIFQYPSSTVWRRNTWDNEAAIRAQCQMSRFGRRARI